MNNHRKLLYTALATVALGAMTAMTPREERTVCHSYAFCEEGVGCQATVNEVLCYGDWMEGGFCIEGCN